MITSLISNLRSRSSVISRSVRPLISTRALGRSFVSGRSRVPRPAARIIAFIGFIGASLAAQILQAEVTDCNANARSGAHSFGELLGEVNGTVLPTGASERHHEIL